MGHKGSKVKSTFNGRVVIDEANDRIVVNDDSQNPIALFGEDANGDIVVKVAKAGQNVLTAPDNELIFNSNQDVFKIVANGTFSFTLPSTTGGLGDHHTIAHGLPYTPAVMGFVEVVVDDDLVGNYWYPTTFNDGNREFSVLADASNIYIRYMFQDISGWGGVVVPFRYYILQETAN